MAEVVLEGVGKTYPGSVPAVQDLTLTVAAGELLVLVGPSGCGKTTTLRLIAGLEEPTHGVIRIGGQAVNALPSWRRDVALAFQRPALYPHLSVRANLAFGLKLRQPGWLRRLAGRLVGRAGPDADLPGRVAEAARMLGLEDVLDRRPGQLSGGQQQRVALGRALVRRPAVLLLDEPLASLDSRQRTGLRRQLHLLHRQVPATIIHVTHDPVEALILGDRVAVLNAGVLEQVGSPETLYRRPCNRFVAGFLGWPPMSFLDGRLQRENGRLYLMGQGSKWQLPLAWAAGPDNKERTVTLGIRPEDVELVVEKACPGSEPDSGVLSLPLEMEITLVEFQGPVSLVTCVRGDWQVTGMVSADGRRSVAEGQTAMVRVRLHQVHLFDGLTGKTLEAGRAPG